MKKWIIFLTTFTLSGCGAQKLIVMNADYLLVHQIEKRLPLDSNQKKDLSKDIDKLLNEQKPNAKKLILFVDDLTPEIEDVNKNYNYMEATYKKVAIDFSSILSKYLAQFNQKQQKEYENLFIKDQNKMRELSQEERIEKACDRFELFFGSLTESQKSFFKDEDFRMKYFSYLKRRDDLQEKIMTIFKEDLKDREKLFLQAFHSYIHQYPDSERNKEFIKKILGSLSSDQKKHFQNKKNDFKEILNDFIQTDY
jgi:hypothetical protein